DLVEALRRFGGELRGDPAADRGADQGHALQLEPVDQLEIDMRDIVDAIDPIGQARIAEAGMRGRDDAVMCGQQRDESVIGRETRAAMQEEQRRARAALMDLELDLAEFQHLPLHARLRFSFQPLFHWAAFEARLGGVSPEISVTSLWRIASAKLS